MLHQLYELVRLCLLNKATALFLHFVMLGRPQRVGLQARKGMRICYVPGNHDEAARVYLTDEAVAFGNVEVRAHASCHGVCVLHQLLDFKIKPYAAV